MQWKSIHRNNIRHSIIMLDYWYIHQFLSAGFFFHRRDRLLMFWMWLIVRNCILHQKLSIWIGFLLMEITATMSFVSRQLISREIHVMTILLYNPCYQFFFLKKIKCRIIISRLPGPILHLANNQQVITQEGLVKRKIVLPYRVRTTRNNLKILLRNNSLKSVINIKNKKNYWSSWHFRSMCWTSV